MWEPKTERFGCVNLIEHQPGKWKLDYRDPRKGGERVRLWLKSAGSYADAVNDAEKHNQYCRGNIDIRPDLQKELREAAAMDAHAAAGLSVSRAMTDAETNLNYRANSLKNYQNDAKHFERYLKEHHGVTTWVAVKPSMIVEYIKHMMNSGLSRNRARLCLIPARITSEHHYADNPDHFRDVYQVKRKEIQRLMKKENWPKPQEAVALTDKQAHALLNFLYTKYPHLYPMARLILATGLRIYECGWIRPCDIDRKKMLLSMKNNNELHKLKTGPSDQPIPVIEWALEAITEWPADETTPLFRNQGGDPWTEDWLNHSWHDACKAARAAGVVPDDFSAKSLRATFATNLAKTRASELVIQRAMRQAPDNVLTQSYAKIPMSELRKLWTTYGQFKLFINYKPNKINVKNVA